MLIPDNKDYLVRLKKEILLKCKKCSGRGVVNGSRCSCLRNFDLYVKLNWSGIEKEFWSLDSEHIISLNKRMDLFYKTVLKGRSSKLFIYPGSIGSSSRGTKIGISLLREFLKSGKTVFYFGLNDYLKEISSKFSKKELDEESSAVMEKILTCDILMVDTMGAECYNESFASSEFEELYRKRKGKLLSTIMNFTVTESYSIKRYKFLSDALNSANSITLKLNNSGK